MNKSWIQLLLIMCFALLGCDNEKTPNLDYVIVLANGKSPNTWVLKINDEAVAVLMVSGTFPEGQSQFSMSDSVSGGGSKSVKTSRVVFHTAESDHEVKWQSTDIHHVIVNGVKHKLSADNGPIEITVQ
ncbi:hypothetical protein SAMN02745181_0473 [Rubritalea squalenifaciens DSM 18772]|uniref:Uncharacterized protein n=2 Tax=Rubritalea squalenifaciens TaxID=407226 RepID=A0A1M6CGB8_9BACT|nr:hypothetical protein SAMN02745181_0473 [Rubritalea squalenifaciens DSM 18772]